MRRLLAIVLVMLATLGIMVYAMLADRERDNPRSGASNQPRLRLSVLPSPRMAIRGDLASPLLPGRRAPLNLILTNPHRFEVRLTTLRVRLRAATTKRKCGSHANYAVTQYVGAYPLVLRPGNTRLSALVPDSLLWPQISMHNLSTDQDACRGAVLALDYSAAVAR